MTANDQRRFTWQQVNTKKKQVSKQVCALALHAKVPRMGPSTVTVRWYVPDRRRRDVDSLGPFLKAALDGLCSAGVWEDDKSDYVTEVRMRIDKSDMKNPRLEILILED